ncbi:MAG: RNA 2'-phosphotransferase [Deltaproteobacteria bacterium]|nr:RNA 2'-phosphotransferase [Deltaproteobacteria bacterium]
MRRLPRPLENLARMLTYILCHRPDEFGLVLDEEGFIPLKQLLAALAGEPGWTHVRRQQVEQVAALWQPPAFEIAGDRIRGLVPGPAQLRRPPGEAPPALLHVGIPPKAHAAVAERGLKPRPGKELVLAGDPQTALKLARRRSPEPVLVTVRARAAAQAGVVFQGYGEGLYLAPAIPREYLQLPPAAPEPERPKPKAKPARPEIPLPPVGALAGDLAAAMKKAGKAARKKGEPAWKTASRRERRKKGGSRR